LLFEITTWNFVIVIIPLDVGLFFDFKLDCVIASSDCGHVPLQLSDLLTLVESSDLNKEHERDESRDHADQCELFGFLCNDFNWLDAIELHKEAGVCFNATNSTSSKIQLTRIKCQKCLFLTNYLLDSG